VVSKLRALMTDEQRAQEDEWAAQIKLCAARQAWRKQKQFVPSRKMTWARWWEKKFGEGETLNEFARRMRKEQQGRSE
jgi:hypothetical protein